MSYLYGASIQGIQGFIFNTSKLKEIIGASQIVKEFDELDFKIQFNLKEEPKKILQAAGNIRLEVKDKTDLEKIVKNFPKFTMNKAYGITVSQAVVENKDYKKDAQELEKKLKIQRNKISKPLDFHFCILKQNPRTALPLINKDYDKATYQKTKKSNEVAKKESKDAIFNIDEISNSKNKIAIIHADGNGLGNIVKDLGENEKIKFSQDLDNAINKAYKEASQNIKKIRKVILGGDDLTVIIDANEALEFTRKFIDEFEKATKNIYKNDSLTACAGIAYCNEKYPFYYAAHLAESLCTQAKKDSKKIDKKLPPSSIMFHNIQSSSIENYEKIIKDELTVTNDKETIKFDFGPYYLHKNEINKPTIKDLQALLIDFKQENSPKGRLRDWLGSLGISKAYAQNELKRINQVTKWKSSNFENLFAGLKMEELTVKKDVAVEESQSSCLNDNEATEKKDGELKTPIYDILQILAVTDNKE